MTTGGGVAPDQKESIMDSVVAVIPARGGSKRIPMKNIRMFAGKPIIAYSIQAACESKIFDRIIVSTDSEQVADIARRLGAEAPFLRPPELSDDYTGTVPVLLHALGWFESNGVSVDVFCCIYATAPFIQPKQLTEGYHLLRRHRAATVFTVTTFPYPIHRSLILNDRGRLEMLWPEHLKKRSQDLPETYHDAGQFYWADARRFREEKRLFSSDAVPLVLPRYSVQDIDTLEDWQTAEKKYLLERSGAYGG
jgi:pseudaminic acid cytidylyltransferase